jgi:hypothetical protein
MSGFKVELDFTGYKDLLDLLSPDELDELLQAIEVEINGALALIFAESQHQVPVDTGLLRASGQIHWAKKDEGGIEGSITYGTHYALWVHEIPMRHDGEGEKEKYLEDPVKEYEGAIARRLKFVIEHYFGGGA